jgi:hypothetical protein
LFNHFNLLENHEKKVGNLFIVSLACADLIVGVFVMPLAGIYAITEDWIMSKLEKRIETNFFC